MNRVTHDWQHDGREYQVRTEGRRILWVRILRQHPTKQAWMDLQLHGPTAAALAKQHDCVISGW